MNILLYNLITAIINKDYFFFIE